MKACFDFKAVSFGSLLLERGINIYNTWKKKEKVGKETMMEEGQNKIKKRLLM